jgi:hypothetical protein
VSVTVNGSVGTETYHAAATSLNYAGITVSAANPMVNSPKNEGPQLLDPAA